MGWASILLGIFLVNFFLWIVTPYYHEYFEKDYWPTWVAALYNSTCRPMFVLGLALIIFPTFVKRGRGIKALLGSDTFAITAKLTFGVYLVRDLVIFLPIFGEGADHSRYITSMGLWLLTASTIVVSFGFSIPFSFLFEVPWMRLETYFLMPAPKARKKKVIESLISDSSETESDAHTKEFVGALPEDG